MTATDLPLLSFFQRVLDPLIIMGMLYLSSMLLGEPFTGYALVLTVMAFFISSSVYEHVDPYSAWRGGRMMASARNVVFGWIITAVILVLLASLRCARPSSSAPTRPASASLKRWSTTRTCS
jgi:putative colanic acid biosynthesis UDP-glucose lipid carrier transferase